MTMPFEKELMNRVLVAVVVAVVVGAGTFGFTYPTRQALNDQGDQYRIEASKRNEARIADLEKWRGSVTESLTTQVTTLQVQIKYLSESVEELKKLVRERVN